LGGKVNINNRMSNNFLVETGKYNQQPPSLSAIPKSTNMPCEQKKAFLYNKAKIKQINQQMPTQTVNNDVGRAFGTFFARGNIFSVVLSALMELLKNQKDVLEHGAGILQTVNQNMTKISNSVYCLQQALDHMLYAIATGPDAHDRFDYSIPKTEMEEGYIFFWFVQWPNAIYENIDKSSTCGDATELIRKNYNAQGIMNRTPFFVMLQLLKRGFPNGVNRLDWIKKDDMYLVPLQSSTWGSKWDRNSFDCYVLHDNSRYARLKVSLAWLQGQESGISADKDQVSSNLDAALNDDSLILREIKKLLDKQSAAGKKLSGFR